MNDKVDWQYLLTDNRARVYLLWAVLVTVGFVATHYFQNKLINGFWATLSVIGLGFMYFIMPLGDKRMRRIFYGWLVTIIFGMTVSGVVFYLETPTTGNLIAHLGAFWLLIMAVGYAWNGLVDAPSNWYWFAAFINLLFGLLCFTMDIFTASQYLIAAIVSAWSMLYLWLFRSSYS
jgi:hypothetical protein